MMKYNGVPFYYQSEKNQFLAMSMAKAKYISTAAAVQHTNATKRLCDQRYILPSHPILVKTDNQSSSAMIKKQHGTKLLKFIYLRDSLIKHLVV